MRMVTVLLLGLCVTAFAQAPKPRPCSTLQHRQFDFWLGSWDVSLPDGKRAGRNRIESVLDGCALHESWTGESGFRGHSYSSYDANRGVWHQTWVDVSGAVLLIEGGLQNGAMVLSGLQQTPQGERLNRISWTPQPGGSLRQQWEISADGGGSWKTIFDGRYVRASDPDR